MLLSSAVKKAIAQLRTKISCDPRFNEKVASEVDEIERLNNVLVEALVAKERALEAVHLRARDVGSHQRTELSRPDRLQSKLAATTNSIGTQKDNEIIDRNSSNGSLRVTSLVTQSGTSLEGKIASQLPILDCVQADSAVKQVSHNGAEVNVVEFSGNGNSSFEEGDLLEARNSKNDDLNNSIERNLRDSLSRASQMVSPSPGQGLVDQLRTQCSLLQQMVIGSQSYLPPSTSETVSRMKVLILHIYVYVNLL